MAKRYDQEVMNGFLIYLKTGKIFPIESSFRDQRHLIRMRNEIAGYVLAPFADQEKEESSSSNCCSTLRPLPPPCSDEFTCRYCPYQLPCYLEHITNENKYHINNPNTILFEGDPDDEFAELNGYDFNENELKYFKKWSQNLLLEQIEVYDKLPRFYSEKNRGKQFRITEIVIGENKNISTDETTGYFIHKFRIKKEEISYYTEKKGSHLYFSGKNNACVNICSGYLADIISDNAMITVLLSTDVRSIFSKIQPVYLDFFDSFSHSTIAIDQGMGNLVNLFQPDYSHLRRIIVDKELVEFPNCGASKKMMINEKILESNLNKYQRQALEKTLNCKNFHLIVGLPGTGKTSTIVELVRQAIYYKMSVLIVSYTNSAVDNVLLKLAATDKNSTKILRIGRKLAMHKDVRNFSEENQTKNLEDPEKLEQFYKDLNVVSGTVLGVDHPLFKWKSFDLCIIDEASQILEPLTLAPLFKTKKFVLVGDFKQLPPLVLSEKAKGKEREADISLFERLARGFPRNLTTLRIQYRMDQRIMDLANDFCYNGKMLLGKRGEKDSSSSGEIQLLNVIDEKQINNKQKIIVSEAEVDKILQFLKELDPNDESLKNEIGIISPFNKQVLKIKNSLPKIWLETAKIEVNTIDRYQGRDKKIIIISFGQQFFREIEDSQTSQQKSILEDFRRINVAITRAKNRLVLVGNFEVLRKFEPCCKILNFLKWEK